mgnify:FL=1
MFTLIFAAMSTLALADEQPTISPVATFFTSNGEEQSSDYQGSAPLRARFEANTANADGWDAHYEWRFYTDPCRQTPYLSRFERDTEVTFTTAGTHYVELYATFVQGTDTVEYTREYWLTAEPIRVSIAESKLEMPNAFTPNGDGVNDVYKAKPGYQSLVEFKAYIFNRWGQKLYQWTDPAGGWDGKFNGQDVKEGVYFVQVNAKGADGKVFNIKKDVNLLRNYIE